ncbi:hypothetical protein MLD38_028394 [Melastoma candidum]|uniref:Uncharacterized protein n=1 Tax=Melastoma candidum TaxID=119954 RepID=A0ACB9N0N2_9MYRT|nr:hypothetical protein MLD38_028394 [Melastoma candidum]
MTSKALEAHGFLRLKTSCKGCVHFQIRICWFAILLLFRAGCSLKGPEMEEHDAVVDFLKGLNDSDHRINWDFHFVSPCFSWSGVTCRDGHVVSLSLTSIGFTGNISVAITKLKYLEILDLQNNRLSGVLPEFLGDKESLETLNLANNGFVGSIPSSWGKLSNLKTLILSGNHLNGAIPESIVNLTGLTKLDLSSTDLSGKIPAQLLKVPSYNFTGTRLLCCSGRDQPCVSPSSNAKVFSRYYNIGATPEECFAVRTRKSEVRVIITSSICGGFVLLSAAAFFAYRCNQLRKQELDFFFDVAGDDERKISFAQVKRFSWREIQIATDNFNENNVIGQGGFGKVYRGILSDGTKVAVKRLADYNSPGGEAAFQREVQLISVAVHRNLLRLIGFVSTPSERILVYPYMKNLSVAYHLRDLKPGEEVLDWPTRKRIAFGAARGLEYLHEHCSPKIIHRDLKAANILLDDSFEAVLGDFGLAKLVDTKRTQVTTQVRGTMGHIAPEYLSTGKSSEKTDVFGYGITLLELVTGQRAIDFSRLEEEEDVLLLDHMKKLMRENRLDDMVDKALPSYDPQSVKMMVQVALLCTHCSPEDRPTMPEVIGMLQGVGLSERWGPWERQEDERNRQSSFLPHHFPWAEETTHLEAIQLSEAR